MNLTLLYRNIIECAVISLNSSKCGKDEQTYSFHVRTVIIRTKKCDEHKEFFKTALKEIVVPALNPYGIKLTDGPSYIHLEKALGDQDIALMLMAIGDYYNWWIAGTPPDILGVNTTQEQNTLLANSGRLLIVPNQNLINLLD